MEISEYFKKLYFSELKLKIKFLEDSYIPELKGSTFRGGFGYVFKRISCPLKLNSCANCIVANSCPYANVFTNPSEINRKTFLPGNSFTPHPFIFDFYDDEKLKKTFFKKDEIFEFSFMIVGNAIRFLSYFIFTFVELGKQGIGKGRYKYNLETVQSGDSVIYESESGKILQENLEILRYKKFTENIKIYNSGTSEDSLKEISLESQPDRKYRIDFKFITPVRIKKDKRYTEFFDFEIFMTNVIRRLYLLTSLFCLEKDDNSEVTGVKEFLEYSKQVITVFNNLVWYDWERYSTRQKISMMLGGLIGKISFCSDGEIINKYFSCLSASKYLHVGKGTTFGLGKFEMSLISNFK